MKLLQDYLEEEIKKTQLAVPRGFNEADRIDVLNLKLFCAIKMLDDLALKFEEQEKAKQPP